MATNIYSRTTADGLTTWYNRKGTQGRKALPPELRKIKFSARITMETSERVKQEAQKYNEVTYQGFDLFEGQTAADLRKEFSKAGYPESVVRKRIEATGAKTYLYKGYTRDTLKNLMRADLFFVDGGHSEETIAQDAAKVLPLFDGSNVAIFDDYYHEGKPEGIGCNKLIDGLGSEYQVEKLPNITDIDGLKIGMVKVSKNADVHLQGQTWTYTRGDIVSV